jgi:tight adherence protein B
MKVLARFGAASLAATVLVGAPMVLAHGQQAAVDIASVDTTTSPKVTVVVTAPVGLAGAGYPPEAFELLEDGSPVPFTIERVPTSNLEIILLVDTSGSMRGPSLVAARAAAIDFLDVLPPEVRVGVVTIGPQPTLVTAPTNDRALVASRLSQLTADGKTALYDSVSFAAKQFTPDATDRAIVLLSDGGDTLSTSTLESAIAAVAGIRVQAIELVTKDSNHAALMQLVTRENGAVTSATDPTALAAAYRSVAGAIVNQYRLRYTTEKTGGQVTLTVRLTTPPGVLEDSAVAAIPAGTTSSPASTAVTSTSVGTRAEGPRSTRVNTLVVRSSPSGMNLIVGAVAFFLCLLLLGLIAAPGDDRVGRVRARLGVAMSATDGHRVADLRDRTADRIEGLLERRGRRRSLAAALDVAGISLRPGELVGMAVVVTILAALAGLALLGAVGVVVALVATPLVFRAIVRRRIERRRQAFNELLPDNLQLLTASLRSGYSLLQGLDHVAREASEPARTEFRRVLLETRVGRDPRDALQALAARMQSEDFDWVVAAIDINRDVGGDLVGVLDNVAETIRDRQRVFRQMRALTAEGRISAYILTGLPLILALVLSVINPDYISRLRSGVGLVLVGIGAGLLLIGWIWMKRLIRIEY